ncbi:MAG TPA: tetratricopeptide repeat protein [Vicinamibacterales bacterium]|nr:tetratricopeptide repeat protein [Vicinamibacterales bacterium]
MAKRRSTSRPKAPGPRPKPVAAPADVRREGFLGLGPWPLGLLICLAVLIAYYPAWHGGILWDDDAHLTAPALQSLDGLRRIWFDLGATQQYYPVTHSAFWLMHRLWGDATLGYHVVNILLHGLTAVLFAMTLRRFAVPGAWLAALVFALHPVHVESVAWMTELKNTLSAPFYLAALLLYVRFDERRDRRAYAGALVLFVIALLSKSVTATLPAAILVIFWWQRGTLRWREDVLPLLPFFALGIAGGLMTAWVERTDIGAEGAEFQFTLIERGLIAGRAFWFYLSKLAWPVHLVFIYPRWAVSQAVAWQYAFPVAAIALVAGLWRLRRWSRAPLAAVLLFAGTLFPALGFVNVYPFVYSFVADHFQYLASLPMIALASAGVATAARRLALAPLASLAAAVAIAGVPLGALTWRQSRQYVNAETHYRTIIRDNPAAWMAYGNLGWALQRAAGDHPTEAMLTETLRLYDQAIRLKPDYSQAYNNLGTALVDLGRLDEAKAAYRTSLKIKPGAREVTNNLALAHNAAGAAALSSGRLEDAVAEYRASIDLNPDDAEAHHNLGSAFGRLGRIDEAIASFNDALRLNPSSSRAHRNLAQALLRANRPDEAIEHFREAMRLDPPNSDAHNDLGVILAELGRIREAVAEFTEAVRIAPGNADARANLERAQRMIK